MEYIISERELSKFMSDLLAELRPESLLKNKQPIELVGEGKVNVKYSMYPNSQTINEVDTEITINDIGFGEVAEKLWDMVENNDGCNIKIYIQKVKE